MNETAKQKIQEIIKMYDLHVKGVVDEASASSDRAFGGVIRADKGKLVEQIA